MSLPAQQEQITEMIKARIYKNCNMTAIGNSERKLKDVAIDLINASGMDHGVIADGCFLCSSTITRLIDGETISPQSETIERIYRYFDLTLTLDGTPIKREFLNRKKVVVD